MCSGRPSAPDPTRVRQIPHVMRAVLRLPLAALSLAPALASAQTSADVAPRPADRLVGGWIGASVASSGRFGPITDRHFFAAALRAQYVLETFGPIAIASNFDLIPLAIPPHTPEYRLRSTRLPAGRSAR